jgi:outer membrane protein OmpA-like peptidoglycan-associated protein
LGKGRAESQRQTSGERYMIFPRVPISLFLATILAAAGGATAARAACENRQAAFDKAVAARSIDDAVRAKDGFALDAGCRHLLNEFRVKLVEFLISYAAMPETSDANRKHAVLTAERAFELYHNWRLAARLADFHMGSGDRRNGYVWYQRAVSDLKIDPGVLPDERLALLTKVATAQSLANDDHEGMKAITYLRASPDEVGGGPGGIYSKDLVRIRGAEVVNIPIPINFYTNETRFTPTGEKALQELFEAARDGQVRKMKLVGHADPRGTPQYNMDLSQRRVMAVRDALLRKELKAQITIDWKGATQRFDIDVLPYKDKISNEERWQLDRRVEWVRDALPE